MIWPVYVVFFGAKISVHLIFEMLAYISAVYFFQWLRNRVSDPIDDHNRMVIFIGGATGAFLGSHFLGSWERPDEFHWDLIYIMANKTIAGGLIGGLCAVELTKKLIGVTTSSGDLMTFPLLSAMFVGRIGCHLSGLEDGTIGSPSTLPWAMNFGDGVLRHPVNLYEMAFLLGLAAFIYYRQRQQPLPNGAQFKTFMIGYMGWRVAIEWLKPVYFWPIGLSSIQIACLGCLLYYAVLSVTQCENCRLTARVFCKKVS
jgi:phosphatidylglycerol---prolipoprotein diacylglyceryl transferase